MSLLVVEVIHPNLLRLWGVCREPSHIAIVTEFMSEGSMEEVLKRIRDGDRDPLMELERLSILKQCALGLQALHNRNIIHRDLSARNILLTTNMRAVISNSLCEYRKRE